jgi:hypothetical protein
LFIACYIGSSGQYFSQGLHYVLIYISYNEILLLLYLFHFYANNIFTTAVKDFHGWVR